MATKFESLPYDLLFQVVYLLSVADILRLRQVSQKFRRLTYEKTVWDNAYRKSSILRPPGPFPSQSSAHLEHELKKCMKLHANWTSQHPHPVSRRTLNLDDNAKANAMILALGRYLLVVGDQGLRCFDLDSSVEELMPRPIASYDLPVFDTYYDPIVDTSTNEDERADGSQLTIVCALLIPTKHQKIVILLDLHILHDTARFELRNEALVPNFSFLYPGTLIGNCLLVNSDGDPTVLHIPTCQLYHLPPCDLPKQRYSCILTSTHLLVQSRHALEAFILPDGVLESAETSAQQKAILIRSHINFHSLYIGPNVFLSSHTTYAHSSGKDPQGRRDLSGGRSSPSTTSITILSQVTSPGRPLEIGFFDIVLNSPADGEGNMTVHFTLGAGLDDRMSLGSLFAGMVQRGCARIIASTSLRTFALTVNVAEGGRSIRVRELDMEKGNGEWEWEWDGLRGRLCRFVSETCIEIHDYV